MKSFLKVFSIFESQENYQNKIHILDPINNEFKTKLLKKGIEWVLGAKVIEADFYAGHLLTRDGENIWTASQAYLKQLSFKVAETFLSESSGLKKLNQEWGHNTILLYLAKHFYRIAGYGGHHTVFKILISEALSRNHANEKHQLILGLPEGYTPHIFEEIRKPLELYTYNIREWSLKKTRLSILLLITYITFKHLLKHVEIFFNSPPELGDQTLPTLLLAQEDDLSMDRSIRGQPHWRHKNDPRPSFRTFILESNKNLYQKSNIQKLEKFLIYLIPESLLYSYSGKYSVHKKINNVIRFLLLKSVLGSPSFSDIAFQLSLVFKRASLLATFCHEQNIKAFMTCENYYPDADAMNLIGYQMGVHTLSYQYSNMSDVGPIMMTTARTMCTFSSLFHDRWKSNGIESLEYVNIGYPFDSSFKQIKLLSENHRNKLSEYGSKFIISYFDESVQKRDNKYGLLNEDDHYNEIFSLVKYLIEKKDIGVITKSQFKQNSLSTLYPNDDFLNKIFQTGRILELHKGKHRNNILPAEAALASDIVIGHVIGATAGLEAALAGKRCLLLNPFKLKGLNINIFNQANILFPNIDGALSAIDEYRNGNPEYDKLGDWSTIIDQFDPFRDGKSAFRLSKVIEDKLNA